MKKLIAYSLLFLFCISACKKDDPVEPTPTPEEPKPIVIDINSPADNAALDLEIPVSVQVMCTRENNGIISKIRIEILDITDAVLETLIDQEINKMGTYSFNNINGFMGPEEGAYKIRVVASEPNGQNEVTKIHKFTLQ